MDTITKQQLAEQLKEVARGLEAEVALEGALKDAKVPSEFSDFASFFQSPEHFKWKLANIKDGGPWTLQAVPCSEAGTECCSLLTAGKSSFDVIRGNTDTEFYRSSRVQDIAITPSVYFHITNFNGLMKLLEKMPDLMVVISPEDKEYLNQKMETEQTNLDNEYKEKKGRIETHRALLHFGISTRQSKKKTV